MDNGFELTEENPRQKANTLSILFFTWMLRFYRKGVKIGLTIKDIYKIRKQDKSDMLGDKLEKNWEKELQRAKEKGEAPSLFKAFKDTFFLSYMSYGCLQFIQFVILKTFQPVILGYIVRLFSLEEDEEENLRPKMYISATVLILTIFVTIFFNHHCTFGLGLVGMRIRISVSTLIYRKMLRLSKKSIGQTAAGQVVNLLSNDVSRFDFVALFIHFIWISPFQVALITYFLWDEVGIACLSGILSMLLLTVPFQGFLGKKTSQVRAKIAVRTDKRVRVMGEIISGIQVIKMYAWEKPFQKMVRAVRAHEVKVLTTAAYIRGIYMSCMVFIERTTLYLTIITYVLTEHIITADKVFSMSSFYSSLQVVLAIFLPTAIALGAEALVSIKRLAAFLVLEEKEHSDIKISNNQEIAIDHVTASWTSDNSTLDNVDFKIPEGKLCAIVGPVGSGKSSLLQLLLGELPIKSGKVSVCGTISYSSQEPWLFGANVRNNILFGQEYKKELYQKVARVCALLPDFDQFPQRDKTIVGERGVSLSGGQRARINLARAVYRNADIYLMDDPLSAVDTHVGKHLFEECIVNYLNGKTRILVTHQLQYLKKADVIIVMNEGRVEAQGTFEELSKNKLDFTKMLAAADETSEEKGKEEEKKVVERKTSLTSIKSVEDVKQTDNEEKAGLIGKNAFKEYLKAAGNCCTLFTVGTIIILGQVACSGADYWVSYWTNQEEIKHANDIKMFRNHFLNTFDYVASNDEFFSYDRTTSIDDEYYSYNSPRKLIEEPIDTNLAIYIYTGIIVSIIVLTLLRSFSFFKICMIASKNLHAMLFNSLLEAPMRFFDINPSGRVLNRFSKDMGAADETLPRVAMEAMQILLMMAGILVMVAVSNYFMIIVIFLFGIIFWFLRKWYLQTVKVVKHIEGIAKSPVFSHINSSLNGISTIRSCGAESELTIKFDHLQDTHTAVWFLTLSCISSFGLWIDIVCVIFTAFTSYSFILMNQFGSVSSSAVGLAISQCLMLTGMFQHGIRQSAEVVNQMTSVERILQYTMLDKEGPFESPKDSEVPKEWPSKGNVKFSHMYLHYTPNDPPVLKDLNFNIKSGQKVGIVGRTGAGKSSLISALFRLAPMEGTIEVDDIASKSIGLTLLRKKISIIPQEPVLFSATLRYNLDPFGEFEDEALWKALEEVELKEAVSSLDFQVEEGGANFSLGQRQLVCLARAILRQNNILVLDEATANVDPKTDGLIQKTIRRKFADCTVLTIAHRLNTIMDSDIVIVMDAGRMIEFDHPHMLLKNNDSHFFKMVAQTGPTMSQTLYQVALDAYNLSQSGTKETSL